MNTSRPAKTSPPKADANSGDSARDPRATAALTSARQELLRADAAANRAMFCTNKTERRRALLAATNHTNIAITLLRGVNI